MNGSRAGPPYRDYTDHILQRWPSARPSEPRPGYGTVFVGEMHEGTWRGVWQDDTGMRGFEGPEAEVLAWARRQPAQHHLVFDQERDTHVPLAGI